MVKNKLAPPFRETEFDMLYGKGISKEGELLDLGLQHELIEKSGPWFSYGSERIGQGRENARIFLADNPDIREEIGHKILEKAGFLQAAAGEEEAKKQEKRKKGG